MARQIISLLIFFFSFSILNAQVDKTTPLPFTQNSSGSRAYFTPEKPSYGDTIKVKFIPGENSPVKDLDSLYLNTLYLHTDKGYKAEEYLMRKTGSEWCVEFKVENEKAGCIAFQFASTNFRKVDCNDERGWDILIYDKGGNPVKGAYKAYALGYMAHGLIRRAQDNDKFYNGMITEQKLYPDDPLNLTNTWFIRLLKGEKRVKIKREMDSLFIKYPDNIDLLESIFSQYNEMKDTVNKDIVHKRILELDPANKISVRAERGNLFFKPADMDKIDALYELINKSKGTRVYTELQRDYFQTLIRAKYYERAFDFLKEWEKPDWIEAIISPRFMLMDCSKADLSPLKLDLDSRIRFNDDETKIKKIMQIAVDMIKYAAAGYRKMDVSERDVDELPSSWLLERNRIIALAYSNLGMAKFLSGDFDTAMAYYNRSKEMMGNEYYMMGDEGYYAMLLKMKKYEYAFDEAKKALEMGCGAKELLHQTLLVAAVTPRMRKEADRIIRKDNTSFKEEREKEINSNYYKEPRDAVDFTLADLNGNKINLASLKGKIVILEFWDTYCGWCEKSFEILKPFFKKHRNDKDVLFLTINTNPASSEKKSTIKRYLAGHKFDFPVLFDEDNSIAASYKMSSVPQTLVMGRDGKVYYRESGYGGPSMADDLEKIVEKIKEIN